MNKILVIADLVEDEPIAVKKGCELAKLYDASLHIVYFCFVDLGNDLDNLESIKSKVIDTTHARAKNLIKDTIEDGINFTLDTIWCKHISEWVNNYVEIEHPLLVVKTGNRTETTLYTPTDWRILRETSAPFYIAHGNAWDKSGSILAAIDLDTRSAEKRELNDLILAKAKQLADHHGLALHACFVPPSPPVLKELGLKFPDEVELKAKERLHDTVQTIAKEYDMDPSRIHIKAGEAHKVIPSLAAKNKARAVVVGTIGRSGLKAKIVGNTAEKILSILRTDVLALKPGVEL